MFEALLVTSKEQNESLEILDVGTPVEYQRRTGTALETFRAIRWIQASLYPREDRLARNGQGDQWGV
ncbi:hypothetical protein [Rhodopirellula sp. MGV]|uniref:hypothetical protein n=1 Tax=Rhodopirellula sp. MGV TaxID=2023130 RepID=UPI000B9759B6|nr:hypothetical protein [Rhodopirellula sp. MGV]OYP36851.1 hypothetical protein CGZ80_07325 [Rhodopirellula sp. MGV]PNY36442.1 hypothetical protein C2E31_12650 [Rhodopirellula baltica]